jgi:pilus assembly protein CpaB
MDQNRKAFFISVGAALFALILVHTYVKQKEAAYVQDFGQEITILVASRDVEEMGQLTDDAVEEKVIPQKFMEPGVITADKRKGFIERRPVASIPIRKGEQLVDTKFDMDGVRTGLSRNVSVGHRAISIPVNDQYGVGKLVKPGDHVDVLSPVRFTSGDTDRIEIKTVLQNVLVLATGEYITGELPRLFQTDAFSGNTRAKSLARDRNFNTVTLETTPQQAQIVTYVATQQGVLYLTLRNPNDANRLDEQELITTTQDDVLGSASEGVRNRRRGLASPQGNTNNQGGTR